MKAEALIVLAAALVVAAWWLDPRPGRVSEGWTSNEPYTRCKADSRGGWTCRTMRQGEADWLFTLPPRD